MDLFRKGESTQVGHKEMNSLNCEMARLLCASSCWRIVQTGAFSVVSLVGQLVIRLGRLIHTNNL